LSLLAVGTLVASLGMLGLAVIPRVGSPQPGRARYFEEQAQFTTHEALLSAVSVDAAVPRERHAQQLLTLSRIARRKYRHLRHAMMAVLVATALMALAILISVAR
jgi:hypothetical protein